MAEATRESASDCIRSVRFARVSFCQAAIISSSRISLYQESKPESVSTVFWRLLASIFSNNVLMCWRATVGEYGGGPTSLNCALAIMLAARNAKDQMLNLVANICSRAVPRACARAPRDTFETTI